MRVLKLLLAGAAVGVIVAAFRDSRTGTWLIPGLPDVGDLETEEMEPVLGYDGMDQETLLEWLEGADLDRDTLERILRYELTHREREPVLSAVEDQIERF